MAGDIAVNSNFLRGVVDNAPCLDSADGLFFFPSVAENKIPLTMGKV